MARRSARGMLASLLDKPDINLQEPWWSKRFQDLAGSAISTYNKAKMYTGNKLDDTYTALTNLLKVADSEAGMEIYEQRLDEFASDSLKFGGYDDNIVQAETLKLLGGQKRKMYDDFTTAIDDTSKFINTDQFLDTADEFVNIQDTIDELNKEGAGHKSVTDFLQSEVANANKLYDDMVGGFQIGKDGEIIGTNFKYNKGVNDKETFRKLQKYRDRLNLATYSLAGDKEISPDEAEAILIGNEEQYNAAKNYALRKAESNFKANKAMVVKYDGLLNTALQGKLSAEDVFKMTPEMDEASRLELGNNLTSGSWDNVIKQLKDEKAEYKRLRNTANENYKKWYGSYYESLEGGLTPDDMDAFDFEVIKSKEDVKKAIKESMGIDVPEVDVTEEQKEETKKKRRQVLGVLPRKVPEDKELYASSDKILEDYIKGDIDADSLREIGGQSLVSDADRIKSASKGAKPKATIIPGVKTKERAPVNIDTLKTLNFTSKAGKYSWHDVVNQIYIKKGRGLSIADDYLSGDINIDDFKLTYRTRRDRAEKIKQRFKELGISIEEFKKKHSKDYKTLINLLGKSRTK